MSDIRFVQSFTPFLDGFRQKYLNDPAIIVIADRKYSATHHKDHDGKPDQYF
jgi:hypothetical protein